MPSGPVNVSGTSSVSGSSGLTAGAERLRPWPLGLVAAGAEGALAGAAVGAGAVGLTSETTRWLVSGWALANRRRFLPVVRTIPSAPRTVSGTSSVSGFSGLSAGAERLCPAVLLAIRRLLPALVDLSVRALISRFSGRPRFLVL